MGKYIKSDVLITRATLADIQKIKELDDLCFGKHHGVSVEEIENIINNGAIFLLFINDRLVGESQIAIKFFDGCHEFPDDCAYLLGTGIHPDFQGSGLGKFLAKEQEFFALSEGKEKLYFTVRVENYSSLKMRIDTGSLITGYDANYYGPNPATDARLVLTKMLKNDVPFEFPSGGQSNYLLPVTFDENVYDEGTHLKIKNMIADSYTGYSVDRSGIWFK